MFFNPYLFYWYCLSNIHYILTMTSLIYICMYILFTLCIYIYIFLCSRCCPWCCPWRRPWRCPWRCPLGVVLDVVLDVVLWCYPWRYSGLIVALLGRLIVTLSTQSLFFSSCSFSSRLRVLGQSRFWDHVSAKAPRVLLLALRTPDS